MMKPKTLLIIAAFSVLMCATLFFAKLNPATVKRFQSQIPEIKEFFLSHKELFLKVEEIRDSKKNIVRVSLKRNPQDREIIMLNYKQVYDEKLESKINYNDSFTLKSSMFFTDEEKETINQLFRANLNKISIMGILQVQDYRIELVSRTDLRIDRMDEEELALARANPYYVTVENIVDDWYIVIFEPQKSLD